MDEAVGDHETGQAGSEVTLEENDFAVVGARCPAVLSTVEETEKVEGAGRGALGEKKPLLPQQHVQGEVRQIY